VTSNSTGKANRSLRLAFFVKPSTRVGASPCGPYPDSLNSHSPPCRPRSRDPTCSPSCTQPAAGRLGGRQWLRPRLPLPWSVRPATPPSIAQAGCQLTRPLVRTDGVTKAGRLRRRLSWVWSRPGDCFSTISGRSASLSGQPATGALPGAWSRLRGRLSRDR
jgi:hypothetical protein